MIATSQADFPIWPLWKKILFRFFFIYLALQITPWPWFDEFHWIAATTKYDYKFGDWLVTIANDKIFPVKKVPVPMNGSGDTSFGWAQLCYFYPSHLWELSFGLF